MEAAVFSCPLEDVDAALAAGAAGEGLPTEGEEPLPEGEGLVREGLGKAGDPPVGDAGAV
jgi:hypothetical protein